jgi:hypothetical protein
MNLAAEVDGVVVELDKYEGPATIAAQSSGPYKLSIAVNPMTERDPLAIRVELPNSGCNTWPAAAVEVRNAYGEALAVRRSGIEWHKLLITVPAVTVQYFVQAVNPPRGKPMNPDEKERQLTDQVTGLNLIISRWHDGRTAALSVRFDDSHPTHLSKAIPILREYGFRGTFMINLGEQEPGSRRRSNFADHRTEWESVAQRGEHEFANYSAHHRGAIGDKDTEAEIGQAAEAIWKLSPGKSKLTALNLGGGTQ